MRSEKRSITLLHQWVATDSAFLYVGFSVQDEPTVNPRQIDRGYPSNRLRDSACHVVK